MFLRNVREKILTTGRNNSEDPVPQELRDESPNHSFPLVKNTRSVRKVTDRIFLCEHLMDYNLARLHEPTLNLSAHA